MAMRAAMLHPGALLSCLDFDGTRECMTEKRMRAAGGSRGKDWGVCVVWRSECGVGWFGGPYVQLRAHVTIRKEANDGGDAACLLPISLISSACSKGYRRAHNFASYGRQRSAKTQDRTAVSPRSLTTTRSQVRALSRPHRFRRYMPLSGASLTLPDPRWQRPGNEPRQAVY